MHKNNICPRSVLMICRVTLAVILCLFLTGLGYAFPLTLSDGSGHKFTLTQSPSRIISLVPAVTEIIAALKADQALVGITYHTIQPARLSRCAVIGGFMNPSLARIKELRPDLLFISDMHKDLREKFTALGCLVVDIRTTSLANAYANIDLIGRIVGRHPEASRLVEGLQQQLALIQRKVAQIPLTKRRRVMQMMGLDEIMVPGDDSFQNELIAAAGGIPPVWGENGPMVILDDAAVRAFDPQLIYARGVDQQPVKAFFGQPAWAGIAAVKTGNIRFFPGALTCRAATHIGDFVGWLAATIYPDYLSLPQNMVLPEKVGDRRVLALDLDYVKKAEVVEMTIADFNHRTLMVDLVEPMQVLSTLDGLRQGVTMVGNHYLPVQTWDLVHRLGAKEFERRIGGLLERHLKTSSLLFTGADMKHLVQQSTSFKDMKVTALVTAGVRSNAVRMGAEEGRFYELKKPGTINIILLTNMHLTPRAMSRAVISACEGKTAALQDLDIRSAGNPVFLQATGTGTDNIVVVEGRGPTIEHAGGHSKMGELIASAVYDGVIEAVRRQNGLQKKRSIFQRLQERRITIYGFLEDCNLAEGLAASDLVATVEEVLLEKRYAAFIESSMALSDAWHRQQLSDLKGFRKWCCRVAEEIAGQPLGSLPRYYQGSKLPEPLRLALDALVGGVEARVKTVSDSD